MADINNVVDDVEKNVDAETVNDTQETEKEKDNFDKVSDWVKNHKLAAVAGAAGTLIASVFVGAKAFSKTKVVEKKPDPIMEHYDKVPIEEHAYTDYKYVLKPEYQDIDSRSDD